MPMKRIHTISSFYRDGRERSAPDEQPGSKRKSSVSPSETVIRNLLSYSMALAVLHTSQAGILNLVMN
jgi:hypothetical protein